MLEEARGWAMEPASATPITRTLHTLTLHLSKGSNLFGVLLGLSLVGFVCLAVFFFMSGPDDDVRIAELVSGAGAVAFLVPAVILHRRRRRRLRIERTGDRTRLVIDGVDFALEFPLTCHGFQIRGEVEGIPNWSVYLQLVDPKRRAVELKGGRSAIHGPQENWFADSFDRDVESAPLFDVSGADTLARVVEWVSSEVTAADVQASGAAGPAGRAGQPRRRDA